MMKKLLFTLLLIPFSFYAQTIINNDFESDGLNTLPEGWVIRYDGTNSADQKVVESPVKNGNHSLQVSGSSWAANLSKSVAEIPNDIILEGWIRAENVATGGRCGLGIGNPSVGTWGSLPARVEFYNGNIITYYHTGNSGGYGTQYILQTALPNTWYHFKIETNSQAGTYKVFINNIQASSNTTGSTITEFPLLTTVTPTSIELYGNSMVYFDDIKLYRTLNPIAYYPFNGNANDESGNGNNGTVNGAILTTDRFGNSDSAYEFDGNDIITIEHEDILNSENELSISVWVKPTILQDAMILGKSNYISKTNYLLRTKSSGFIQFEYKDFANTNSLPYTANQWNHIVVVSETDNSKKVYLNNTLVSHTSASSPYGLVTNILTIGARPGAEFYNGTIDDLSIYKRALSTAEVSSLFINNTLKIEKFENTTENTFYVSNNLLFFKNSQNLQEIKTIEVYNLLGQKVFKTSTIEKVVSLQQLKKGIYILKVKKTTNDLKTLKFIIN